LGSGIKRALEAWPEIDFIDDQEGCLFTAIVNRSEVEVSSKSSVKNSVKSSVKTEEVILHLLSQNPKMTAKDLAETLEITLRAVEKQLANLKKDNKLERIGPDKGGYWKVTK